MKIGLILVNFLLPYLGNFMNDRTRLFPLIAVISLIVFLVFFEEDVLLGHLYIRWSTGAFILVLTGLIIHSIVSLGEIRVTFRDFCVGLTFGILFTVATYIFGWRENAFVLAADTLEPYGSGAVLVADRSSPVVGDAIVARDIADKGRSHFGILGGLPGWTLKRNPDGSFDSCSDAGECVSTQSMCITTLDDVETYRLGPNEAVIFKIREVGHVGTHLEKVKDIRRVVRYFDANTLVEFAKPVENGCSWIKDH